MEGSRHERAAVLVAAYIIGFTTAYIGFGVSQLGGGINLTVPTANTASVINATPAATPAPAAVGISGATVTPQGLVAIIQGKQVPISATMASPKSGILPDGYNVAIPDYSISPDGQYLYYCEQPSAAVSSCKPFVYSVSDGGAHAVTQNGSRIAFAIDAPKAIWNANGTLSADGMTSVGNPWMF